MVRIFTTLIVLIISQTILPAQVRFFIDYNARTTEYTVSMMPERTWRPPFNKTATGQVTIKATTGQFFIKDIKSYVEDTNWVPSGRVTSPVESPDYDYVFFRLKTPGLAEMPFKAFKPVKLFTFTLQSNCAREVMLVSNVYDAFMPPNSRNINIGNSLGVLGANGEAYSGNVSNLPIFCPWAEPPAAKEAPAEGDSKIIAPVVTENALVAEKLLYPNPTINEVQVTLDWKGTSGQKTILVYNGMGQVALEFQEDLQVGANKFTLNLSKLDNGIYNFFLVDDQQNLDLGKVIKIK